MAAVHLMDLVSMTEIADRCGVTTNAVKQWRRRYPEFPAPLVTLAIGPVWDWPPVRDWLVDTGRLRGGRSSR